MIHKLNKLIILSVSLMALTTVTNAQKLQEEGAHVRLMKNVDGSTSEFKRDHTNTKLEQTSYIEKQNGEKIVRTRTVYRRDKNGRLRSGIIEDGQRIKLYRIIYGYDPSGRLIAENMYDARQIRRNDNANPDRETPVRALRYSYDPQGRRNRPVAYVGVKGKTAEQLRAWIKENKFEKGTQPTLDPFRNDKVNP